jgi:CheY-like chemotaxis protein
MDRGQSKHRLLLVDGDPKSLRVLEVSLKKAGFEVVTATQGRDALGALQAALPDLIISDTDLDGMDGFDLCRQIKAKPEWAKLPFLFVSGRKSIEDKIRGLELGVEDYLTKPIYIKEIGIRVRTALQRVERERLESRREGRTKFAGDLSDIGVVDLVQTIDLNRKSGIVHIVNRDGRRGAIFFREGRVIDAEVGRLSGAEAMYRLFSWSDGQFEVEFKPIRRRDVIDLPSAALLMEGMRRLDEWTRLLENLPALDSVVEVDVHVLAEQLVDLPDEMNGFLRLSDGTRSLLAVIDESDYPDLEALTVVSKLFGQGIIYAREPAGRRGGAEPGSELARWLAEGNAEDSAVADETSAAQQFATEAETAGSGDAAASEGRSTTDDAPVSGAWQGGKTLKTFSPDATTLSLDTPPPGREAPRAPAEPDTVASGSKLKGNTLRLAAVVSDQDSAIARPASAPDLPRIGDSASEAASPLEVSAVVEDSWREPAELASGLSRTGGGGPRPAEAVKSAADAAGAMAKPDTLKGFPLPGALAQADQAGPVRKPAASDEGRPARTTIEFGPRKGDVTPLAGAASPPTPAGEPARETDWGGWAQGTESKPAAASDPLQADAPCAEPGDKAAGLPGRISEGAPQIQRADDTPATAEARPASRSPGEGQPIKTRPTIDRLDGDLVPHERRWPLLLVVIALLVAGGLFAMRTSLTREWWLRFSRPELPAETAPTALVSSAIEAGQGLGNQGSLQAADQAPGSQPIAALAGAEKQIAAPADAQARLAAWQEPGSQPKVASAEMPSRTADGGQAHPPTLGSAAPGMGELRERCMKANAGGKGKPMVVLPACRSAVEAEPGAVDIMMILARVELDRGRAAEARSWAKKALYVNPDLADAYVVLGGAEQESENPDAAKAAYKKYLELAPKGRHARELRTILDSL